jgi:hypothetical protein
MWYLILELFWQCGIIFFILFSDSVSMVTIAESKQSRNNIRCILDSW